MYAIRSYYVQYAEMTLTKMLDPKWVQVLNDNMPRIEAETGVSIRYLAGLIRHMDEPTNMYNIEKLKVLSKTPYIVGVDFIGHETNPTKEILPQMEELAKWIKAEKPDFILRVHAGESDLCDENVITSYSIHYTKLYDGLSPWLAYLLKLNEMVSL